MLSTKKQIKLIKIPDKQYTSYRQQVIFQGYKWDPQVYDSNTVSEYAVVLNEETEQELASLAEELAAETTAIEAQLLADRSLINALKLPRRIRNQLKKHRNYDSSRHIRLMRFDFHPTTEGWQISEVNSDVPGGFAESSILPELAKRYLTDVQESQKVSEHLLLAFKKRISLGARIAFVHATSYADDRQVMQFMGDHFQHNGYQAVYLAPDRLSFREGVAYEKDNQTNIQGIVRFFPLEWMLCLPFLTQWQGFYQTSTVSCNHPFAILTQSKRLPLLFQHLGQPTLWNKLLPETKAVEALDYEDSDYLYKPVFGRVGESITIRERTSENEFKKIRRDALRFKKEWIVQKRFDSQPILTEDGRAFHLCLGVFVIDGKFAGIYGRISSYARIDEKAQDLPVLIHRKKEGEM